jgi:hypothetical protein
VREVETRGLGSVKKSSTWSQSPTGVAKNKKTKKIGKASAIWSKLWPGPEVMAIDRTSTRAIMDMTANVHMDRISPDCCFALGIASDSTEGILPSPAGDRRDAPAEKLALLRNLCRQDAVILRG